MENPFSEGQWRERDKGLSGRETQNWGLYPCCIYLCLGTPPYPMYAFCLRSKWENLSLLNGSWTQNIVSVVPNEMPVKSNQGPSDIVFEKSQVMLDKPVDFKTKLYLYVSLELGQSWKGHPNPVTVSGPNQQNSEQKSPLPGKCRRNSQFSFGMHAILYIKGKQ